MNWTEDAILEVMDACCRKFSFPMLDNGYVHMAASRLFLFRTEVDWALTMETFGFSARAEEPEIQVVTFGSRLVNRPEPEDFINDHAWRQHLANHPHDEVRYVFPVEGGNWLDGEQVAVDAEEVVVRGAFVPLPARSEYESLGIPLRDPDRVLVYELCRYLAATRREQVLCKPEELIVNLPPEMKLMLKLDEWNHPDLAKSEVASTSETFRMLARVLVSGDVADYRPTLKPNTHWKNWPDGGSS